MTMTVVVAVAVVVTMSVVVAMTMTVTVALNHNRRHTVHMAATHTVTHNQNNIISYQAKAKPGVLMCEREERRRTAGRHRREQGHHRRARQGSGREERHSRARHRSAAEPCQGSGPAAHHRQAAGGCNLLTQRAHV
jgi:hypothetical protein